MWIDIVGWIGVVAITAAYAGLTTKRISGESMHYFLLNVLGGVCLIINAYYYGAYPVLGTNIIWITIALLGLLRKAKSDDICVAK